MLSQGQHISQSELDTLLGPLQFLLLYRATAVTARTPERRRAALVAGVAILGIYYTGVTRVMVGLAVVVVAGLLVFGARIDARSPRNTGARRGRGARRSFRKRSSTGSTSGAPS